MVPKKFFLVERMKDGALTCEPISAEVLEKLGEMLKKTEPANLQNGGFNIYSASATPNSVDSYNFLTVRKGAFMFSLAALPSPAAAKAVPAPVSPEKTTASTPSPRNKPVSVPPPLPKPAAEKRP